MTVTQKYMAFVNEGVNCMEQGLFVMAISVFTHAMNLPVTEKESYMAHFYRGAAYLSNGDHNNAVEDFGYVLGKEPTHKESRKLLENIRQNDDIDITIRKSAETYLENK